MLRFWLWSRVTSSKRLSHIFSPCYWRIKSANNLPLTKLKYYFFSHTWRLGTNLIVNISLTAIFLNIWKGRRLCEKARIFTGNSGWRSLLESCWRDHHLEANCAEKWNSAYVRIYFAKSIEKSYILMLSRSSKSHHPSIIKQERPNAYEPNSYARML